MDPFFFFSFLLLLLHGGPVTVGLREPRRKEGGGDEHGSRSYIYELTRGKEGGVGAATGAEKEHLAQRDP